MIHSIQTYNLKIIQTIIIFDIFSDGSQSIISQLSLILFTHINFFLHSRVIPISFSFISQYLHFHTRSLIKVYFFNTFLLFLLLASEVFSLVLQFTYFYPILAFSGTAFSILSLSLQLCLLCNLQILQYHKIKLQLITKPPPILIHVKHEL